MGLSGAVREQRKLAGDLLAARPIARAELLVLLGVLTWAAIPHAWHLSPWMLGFFLVMAGLRLAMMMGRVRPLRQPWLVALTAAAMVNVLVHEGTADITRAATGFLLCMLGLKLLELRSRRDFYITAILGWFLIGTQFLYDNSLGMALLLVVPTLGLALVLVQANHSERSRDYQASLRMVLTMFGYALPLAALMFILFPRLDGPLWGNDVKSGAGVSGLSDRIQLGSISRLIQSSAPVMRVSFEGAPPRARDRYWRGPVLWNTDGVNWRTSPFRFRDPAPLAPLGAPTDYVVTLEPTNQRWLFVLDMPEKAPRGGRLMSSHQVMVRTPVSRRTDYAARSFTRYRFRKLYEWERRLATRLPELLSQRVRGLARRWREQAGDDAGIVQLALRHYREQPFVYTLEPPPLGDDPVDGFLFDTRRGFCEHYATSFVTLMRAAGIPARVVTGYQGGEWNPSGNFLLVRQSDAHAWAEVWLQGSGWVRVDPTAAVAPERIERSIDNSTGSAGAPAAFSNSGAGWLGGLWRESRWLMDAVNMRWHRWIVGYSRRSQNRFLDNLGLGFLKGYWLGIAVVIVAALFSLFILWRLRLTRVRQRDRLQQTYLRLQRKLLKAGLEFGPGDAPLTRITAAAKRYPASTLALREIVLLYERLRYSKLEPAAAELQRLRRKIKHLKLTASG